MKHLKVLVKWNWWWNFACVSTKSLDFEIYFLSFPKEIVFGVISGNYSGTDFCPLNLKLLYFLSDFVLTSREKVQTVSNIFDGFFPRLNQNVFWIKNEHAKPLFTPFSGKFQGKPFWFLSSKSCQGKRCANFLKFSRQKSWYIEGAIFLNTF